MSFQKSKILTRKQSRQLLREHILHSKGKAQNAGTANQCCVLTRDKNTTSFRVRKLKS